MALTFLGVTEEITSCDCCGKSELLCTVAMQTEDGEVVYYGRTCASRHSGRKVEAMVSEKKKQDAVMRAAINIRIKQSPLYHALQAKFAQRVNAKLPPGKAAKEFLEPELGAFQAFENETWKNAPVSRN